MNIRYFRFRGFVHRGPDLVLAGRDRGGRDQLADGLPRQSLRRPDVPPLQAGPGSDQLEVLEEEKEAR